MKILDIFCDASITSGFVHRLPSDGCAGSVAVSEGNMIDLKTVLIPNTTNNYSEITAIRLGITQALFYKNSFDIINIFSDSKICIFGLREWIYKWEKIGEVLYNSSRNPVANQDVFVNIANEILRNNLVVNLYHMRAHTANTPTALVKQQLMFRTDNMINIDYDTAVYISKWNNYIDVVTGNELVNYKHKLYDPNGLMVPASFTMEGFDFNNYKELLRKNFYNGIGEKINYNKEIK